MMETTASAGAASAGALPPETDELFQAIAGLRSAEEVAVFMRDLCTISELRAMSGRWQMALLLEQGISYLEIAKRTGASTATVTRVSNWLRFGSGGYRLMLDRRRRAKKR
ncbi:MAG TPA: YerC/YecD family TrpR-related protein [Candidatus Dormibacteraeota bacterium]|nr:YerC/YecD family TrpR-related protein [Candidatus Dormibacteraeota bacterium]